jgi:hypothetical protein
MIGIWRSPTNQPRHWWYVCVADYNASHSFASPNSGDDDNDDTSGMREAHEMIESAQDHGDDEFSSDLTSILNDCAAGDDDEMVSDLSQMYVARCTTTNLMCTPDLLRLVVSLGIKKPEALTSIEPADDIGNAQALTTNDRADTVRLVDVVDVDEDSDGEYIDVDSDDDKRKPSKSKSKSKSKAEDKPKIRKAPSRRLSKGEREVAVEFHKAHLLALLGHCLYLCENIITNVELQVCMRVEYKQSASRIANTDAVHRECV